MGKMAGIMTFSKGCANEDSDDVFYSLLNSYTQKHWMILADLKEQWREFSTTQRNSSSTNRHFFAVKIAQSREHFEEN